MKKIILSLIFLMPFIVKAQTAFPVFQTNNTTSQVTQGYGVLDPVQNYFKNIAAGVSGTGSTVATVTKSTVTTGNGFSAGLTTSIPGRMSDVRRVFIRSSRQVGLTLTKNFNTINFPLLGEFYTIPANTDVYIECPIIVRPGGSSIALFVNKWYDADTTAAVINITYVGSTKTDDVITNSVFDMLTVGTSIESGTGYTATSDMWCVKLRNWLRFQSQLTGLPATPVNLGWQNRSAASASTATHMNNFLNNSYNLPSAQFLIISTLGVNDASAGNPVDTYRVHILAEIDAWLAGNPKGYVLLTGAPPLMNNTQEALAVQYRGVDSLIAATYSISGKVWAVNETDIFDRTNPANYNAGDGIHMTAPNHTLYCNRIISYFQGKNAGLLTILKNIKSSY